LIRREDFADDVEHGVIVQGIADELEFLQEFVKNAAFDSILRKEIEDEAILRLAVAMYAAHALFESVRVPRNIVVEQDMTALEVDAFARGFGRREDLRFQIPEVSLGPKARALFVPASGLHAAVNLADG